MKQKAQELKEELWKAIPGYDNYIASTWGRIMVLPVLGNSLTGSKFTDGRSGRILKPRANLMGYYQVALRVNGKPKYMYVHRLVAMAFLKSRRGCDIVMHKDDNPKNNCPQNLMWGTHYQNSQMITVRNLPKTRGKMEANRLKVAALVKGNMKNYSGTMRELFNTIAKDLGISYQYVIHLWYHNNPHKLNVKNIKQRL